MKLPFSKFFEKKPLPEYFLAFLLRHEKANAVIFEKINGIAKVIGQGEANFEKSIEDATFEELLSTSDKAISEAEKAMPKEVETLKTLFGLKDSWIEEDKIKKDYLDKLKKVSEELGLTPIGFITVTEAISGLLKKEEGIPLTAILSEIGKNYVTVSLIKAGKIMETKSSEIHENPPFTVDILLKHFEIPEVLPSKVIIYDGEEEKLAQEFIHHQWSKSLPFLHVPQIVNLPLGFDAKAILAGAATQMGFSIDTDTIEKNLTSEKEEIPEITKDETRQEVKEEKKDNILPSGKLEDNEEINYVENDTFVENFGFFEGEDITKLPKKQSEEETIQNEKYEEKKEPETARIAVEKEETPNKEAKDIKINIKKNINLISEIKSRILGISEKIKLPKKIFNNRLLKQRIIFIPGLLATLLIITFIYFFFTIRAEVILTLNPKIEEQKENVTFSAKATDVGKKTIQGEFISASLEKTSVIATTGKKETGTEAKGTVTFYSRFTQKRTITAGTLLTSSNNLEFTLDKAVDISSASADADASPVTVSGSVTAKEIGKESNLPSGAKFTVGDFPSGSIIAKNDSAFSGGTKKEITIVSKEDQNKLLSKLIKDYENEAREELEKKANDEKIFLPVITSTEVEKKDYDKDIGDEAGKLTLKAKIVYEGLLYSKKDLASFTKSLLKKQLSEELEVDEKNIKIEVSDVKSKEEEVSAMLKIQAPLLPKINSSKIIKEVTGISVKDAKEKLSSIEQVVDAEIKFSPNLPIISNSLPRFSQNIKISTETNE